MGKFLTYLDGDAFPGSPCWYLKFKGASEVRRRQEGEAASNVGGKENAENLGRKQVGSDVFVQLTNQAVHK